MPDYVDVRGVWPVYVRGQIAVELRGKHRSISLEDARHVGCFLLGITIGEVQ
jgi:hypothetical protein